jgi:hypothetical protein
VFAMEARLVERLEPTNLVTLARDGWSATLRKSATATPTVGPVAQVAHLFDTTTGLTLSHGRPEG